MANENYVAFVDKVINMTKDHTLTWKYLDTEVALCRAMEWIAESRNNIFYAIGDGFRSKSFDDEDSFVCCKDNMYFVIWVGVHSSLPILYVIPHTYKGIVALETDEYGEYTTRLHNLVKRQFPHADTYIKDFLTEK